MKTRLLEIINAGANKLTKDDKIFITMCAEELRQKAPAGSCRSCYIDSAVFLAQEIERQEEKAKEEQELENLQSVEAITEEIEAPAEPVTETERKILIKKGVDIIVNGVRVNRYTITTDAQAEALLKIIDRKYFEFL